MPADIGILLCNLSDGKIQSLSDACGEILRHSLKNWSSVGWHATGALDRSVFGSSKLAADQRRSTCVNPSLMSPHRRPTASDARKPVQATSNTSTLCRGFSSTSMIRIVSDDGTMTGS